MFVPDAPTNKASSPVCGYSNRAYSRGQILNQPNARQLLLSASVNPSKQEH